jgi:N-acetylglucosamine-6-phosphate deacetylase
MKTAFLNCRVFDGDELHLNMAVVVEGGRFVEISPAKQFSGMFDTCLDLQQHILAPGLIDIQVNGGGGVMFNDDPSVETIRTMASAHRRFGTTGFLPTLISTDFNVMQQAVEAVAQAIDEGVPGVLGVHLEGPYLNSDKCGIHNVDKFKHLDEAAFELLTSLANGRMLVTIAPELTNSSFIHRLTDAGVLVFGGHSNATYEQTIDALDAGLQGFTHLFNAMSQFGSREPGMVGAALEDQNSWCGIIADGQHVHPVSFSLAVAAKRKGFTVLVTDAMATVGSDISSFIFDGVDLEVINGSCRTPEGQLAGSNLDMITAVRNAASFARLDSFEALRMASCYPAHVLGLQDQLAFIREGYLASFIEIDDDLNLYRSWVDGRMTG